MVGRQRDGVSIGSGAEGQETKRADSGVRLVEGIKIRDLRTIWRKEGGNVCTFRVQQLSQTCHVWRRVQYTVSYCRLTNVVTGSSLNLAGQARTIRASNTVVSINVATGSSLRLAGHTQTIRASNTVVSINVATGSSLRLAGHTQTISEEPVTRFLQTTVSELNRFWLNQGQNFLLSAALVTSHIRSTSYPSDVQLFERFLSDLAQSKHPPRSKLDLTGNR
ncbi:hypothetical protein CROQUDRAFT_100602 [Cronartium quercuum f. sp. fusiforme G11]|uniref:Uncharacterized protein n=1 Tax=Cronartium quercuum f. sp. fusiforme G11 TaxID=708437 RepID=A0A9P6N608_9BASI|nr:hypothetical protein CROQUDRAFT_100602 [Cronartium quercuum f. sp. fusiforme G11]